MIKDSAIIYPATSGGGYKKQCKTKPFCKIAPAPAYIDLKILSLQLNLVK